MDDEALTLHHSDCEICGWGEPYYGEDRMMTDDPIPTEFIGEATCPRSYPHESHDWFVFNNLEGKISAYRCYGVRDD